MHIERFCNLKSGLLRYEEYGYTETLQCSTSEALAKGWPIWMGWGCQKASYVKTQSMLILRGGKSWIMQSRERVRVFFFLNSDRPVMSNHTIVSAGAVGNPVHPLSSNFSRNYFFITVISLFICLWHHRKWGQDSYSQYSFIKWQNRQ